MEGLSCVGGAALAGVESVAVGRLSAGEREGKEGEHGEVDPVEGQRGRECRRVSGRVHGAV